MEEKIESQNHAAAIIWAVLQCDNDCEVRMEAKSIEEIVVCLQQYGGSVSVYRVEVVNKWYVQYQFSASHEKCPDKSIRIFVEREIPENAARAQKAAFNGQKLIDLPQHLDYTIIDNAFFVPHIDYNED